MKFDSKEELLVDVEKNVVEEKDENGAVSYSLKNSELDSIRADLRNEIDNAKKQREKKQEYFNQLGETNKKLEEATRLLNDFKSQNPDELKDALRKKSEEYSATLSKAQELEKQLDAYRRGEQTRTIEEAIVAEATKLGVVPSALRDAKRLSSLFKIDDTGLVRALDGKSVGEVLSSEVANCPHWLSRSTGGGAEGAPSPAQVPLASANQSIETRYNQAVSDGDTIRAAALKLAALVKKGQ